MKLNYKRSLTPHFISFEIVYEAMDLIDDIEDENSTMKPRNR